MFLHLYGIYNIFHLTFGVYNLDNVALALKKGEEWSRHQISLWTWTFWKKVKQVWFDIRMRRWQIIYCFGELFCLDVVFWYCKNMCHVFSVFINIADEWSHVNAYNSVFLAVFFLLFTFYSPLFHCWLMNIVICHSLV